MEVKCIFEKLIVDVCLATSHPAWLTLKRNSSTTSGSTCLTVLELEKRHFPSGLADFEKEFVYNVSVISHPALAVFGKADISGKMFRQADVYGRQAARDELLKRSETISLEKRSVDNALDIAMPDDVSELEVDDEAVDNEGSDTIVQQRVVASDPLTTEEFEIMLAWRSLTGAISDSTLNDLCDDFSYLNLHVKKRNIRHIQRDLIRSSNLKSFRLCYQCCRPDCKEHPLEFTVITVNIESQLKFIATRYKELIDDQMVLVMNTDGVRPRDHVKLSIWPIFFYVHSLPLHLRGLKENCIIGALISGPSSPSIEILEYASRHFKQLLPHGRIQVWRDDLLNDIRIDLEHVIMDIPV
uniref:CRAL-TRIO domain-containing protein n=1 Tax=Panagrellus redivivus TaxID=6233 RepID=A0A7E4WBM9_PANRE